MESAALLGGGGAAIGVFVLYWVLKRLRRSTCAIDHCSGCLTIEIPQDIALVKQKTDRLEKLMAEMAMRLQPEVSSSPNKPSSAAALSSEGTHHKLFGL
jgi:hypothetical protein